MTVTQNRKPTRHIFAVRKIGNEKAFWTEIGSAWPNKDGKGLSLKFNLMPRSL